MNIEPETLNQLIILAQKKVPDDFNVYDYSGGNYDDAYLLGLDHGEIGLARLVLDNLGVKY